jgi:hypothetical protein
MLHTCIHIHTIQIIYGIPQTYISVTIPAKYKPWQFDVSIAYLSAKVHHHSLPHQGANHVEADKRSGCTHTRAGWPNKSYRLLLLKAVQTHNKLYIHDYIHTYMLTYCNHHIHSYTSCCAAFWLVPTVAKWLFIRRKMNSQMELTLLAFLSPTHTFIHKLEVCIHTVNTYSTYMLIL